MYKKEGRQKSFDYTNQLFKVVGRVNHPGLFCHCHHSIAEMQYERPLLGGLSLSDAQLMPQFGLPTTKS